MSHRQFPPSSQGLPSNSAATAVRSDLSLLAWEMPATDAYAAFSQSLDAGLSRLEERFRDFCTRDSVAGSLKR